MSVTYECPSCGTRSTYDAVQRSADQFCPECDYPLFWATPVADPANGTEVMVEVGPGPGPTLLRRPGVGGRMLPAGEQCPTCGEVNVLTAEFCVRCGSPMRPLPPEPEPEPEPEREPQPEPEPEPEPQPQSMWLPVILVVVLVLIAATAVVFVVAQ